MTLDFNQEVKLFMVFDILGDTERTGPKLWKVERSRLEDIKNHTLDLILMYRIVRDKLPIILDESKILDYFICHDLPEAITGDITKFQGVSSSERKRVTDLAIKYLSDTYGDIIDFGTIINGFEAQGDIEAKIAKMFDSIHSSTTFMKYQSEQNVDMDKPGIIPVLRNLSFVVEKIAEGIKLMNEQKLADVLSNIDKNDFATVIERLEINFDPEALTKKLNDTLPGTIDKVNDDIKESQEKKENYGEFGKNK